MWDNLWWQEVFPGLHVAGEGGSLNYKKAWRNFGGGDRIFIYSLSCCDSGLTSQNSSNCTL
jgi:hypothetical protein